MSAHDIARSVADHSGCAGMTSWGKLALRHETLALWKHHFVGAASAAMLLLQQKSIAAEAAPTGILYPVAARDLSQCAGSGCAGCCCAGCAGGAGLLKS